MVEIKITEKVLRNSNKFYIHSETPAKKKGRERERDTQTFDLKLKLKNEIKIFLVEKPKALKSILLKLN